MIYSATDGQASMTLMPVKEGYAWLVGAEFYPKAFSTKADAIEWLIEKDKQYE